MKKSIILIVMLMLWVFPSVILASLPGTLTPEEITWLETAQKKEITYLIPPKFVPISFVKDGQPTGIVTEYLQILSKELGLNLKHLNISWKQGMAMAKAGQVDFFPCLSLSKEREAFISFTRDHYITFSLVIVTQKGAHPVRKIEDLAGRRVAVDKDLVAYSKLINDFPHLDIKFVFKKNVGNVLKAVHLGEADACLSSSANAGYLISQNGWNNLKISGETGWNEIFMRMGTRKDWPHFLSIIEKTMAAIPESKHKEIKENWIPVQFEHSFDSQYVLKRILPVLAGILAVTLVIGLFLVIVIKKNKQLKQAKSALKEANQAIGQFLDNSGQGFLSFGADLVVEKECSLECKRIFDQPVPGKTIHTLLCPKDTQAHLDLEKNLKRIFKEADDYRRSLYLSLMQTEFQVEQKTVSTEYKMVDGLKMMMILTDITSHRTDIPRVKKIIFMI